MTVFERRMAGPNTSISQGLLHALARERERYEFVMIELTLRTTHTHGNDAGNTVIMRPHSDRLNFPCKQSILIIRI